MTFKLKYESLIKTNERLQLTYSVEGKLPLEGHKIQAPSFNSNGHSFNVKYSITGNFIVDTDLNYLQQKQNIGLELTSEIVDPIELIHDKVHRCISSEFERMKRNLKSSQ